MDWNPDSYDGTGLFLKILYEMGLDVSGIDSSPEMIMAARRRFGKGADLHLGNGELTPFSDNEFDYVFLWSVLEFTESPRVMLAEAVRVAEKGLLIGFLNKYSLYYAMNVRGTGSTLDKGNWLTWYQMQSLIKEVTDFRPTMARSVLPGPVQTWQEDALCKSLNNVLYPPFMGAFVAVRVDFVNMKPFNPLFAWKTEPEMG